MPDRELDPGEFHCVNCGAISGPHPKDGMAECAQCVDEAEQSDEDQSSDKFKR